MATDTPDQPAPSTTLSSSPSAPAPAALTPSAPAAFPARPRKRMPRRFWDALKSVSLLVSMIVNLILIIIVVILLNQVGAIKLTLGNILGQLDSAFEGLGQATIVDTIAIKQQVPVQFDLSLNQDTTVVTQAPVPLSVPTTFSLGPFGTINGTVSLALPAGTALPVHLQLTVPVSTSIPVVFDQPVSINLYQKGLASVVDKLRAALAPLITTVKQLPDAFVIIP